MTNVDYSITIAEAVKLTGLSRRAIAWAVHTDKLTARKLPGRTGHYLLNVDEVRKFAASKVRAA